MAEQTWYYANGDRRIGPVSADEIERQIAAGRIGAGTLVWSQGMGDWMPAETRFKMAAGAPPPMPAAAQPAWQGSPAGAQLGPDGLYVGAPSRGFGEAIRTCFEKYVRFKGRASRSEYWWFYLFCILGSIATTLLDLAIFGADMMQSQALNSIFSLVIFLPTMAVTWRRLHDTGRSGWIIGGFYIAVFVVTVVMVVAFAGAFASDVALGNDSDAAIAALGSGFVVFVGLLGIGILVYAIVVLVFLCQKGEPGPNRFG